MIPTGDIRRYERQPSRQLGRLRRARTVDLSVVIWSAVRRARRKYGLVALAHFPGLGSFGIDPFPWPTWSAPSRRDRGCADRMVLSNGAVRLRRSTREAGR